MSAYFMLDCVLRSFHAFLRISPQLYKILQISKKEIEIVKDQIIYPGLTAYKDHTITNMVLGFWTCKFARLSELLSLEGQRSSWNGGQYSKAVFGIMLGSAFVGIYVLRE